MQLVTITTVYRTVLTWNEWDRGKSATVSTRRFIMFDMARVGLGIVLRGSSGTPASWHRSGSFSQSACSYRSRSSNTAPYRFTYTRKTPI